MTADKQVLEAVERAQAILARYVEPGKRDCERTINDLLDVLDRDEVVAAIEELEQRGEAVAELRRLLDRGASAWSSPPRNAVEPDLPPMPSEKRPQDPTMDGKDMRFEGAITSKPKSTPANIPTRCRRSSK